MLKKIIALVFFSFILISCGTKVVEIKEEAVNTETNITAAEEENDPIIEDFKNELDTLLESSEEDA